jgi:hypothetical protein
MSNCSPAAECIGHIFPLKFNIGPQKTFMFLMSKANNVRYRYQVTFVPPYPLIQYLGFTAVRKNWEIEEIKAS